MPKVRNMVVALPIHNSGIRDIEDGLGIHRDNLMAAIQRAADAILRAPPSKVRVVYTAELDEFWSFVRSKEHQQWT